MGKVKAAHRLRTRGESHRNSGKGDTLLNLGNIEMTMKHPGRSMSLVIGVGSSIKRLGQEPYFEAFII